MKIKTVWMFTGNQCHKIYTTGTAPFFPEPGTYCYDPSLEVQKSLWAVFRQDSALAVWEDIPAEEVPPTIRARMMVMAP